MMSWKAVVEPTFIKTKRQDRIVVSAMAYKGMELLGST